ncbi:MAG: fused response regulator/phosphatase [bacterium]|nr:fused response regulator/phosphatase [bacterium]
MAAEKSNTIKQKNYKRILVAEDTEIYRQTLEAILGSGGFEVTAVEDGRKALDLLVERNKNHDSQHAPFDLLVTDIEMPEMTGIQLIDELKQQNIELPIQVITAFGAKEIVIELLRKGCNDFIEKPIEADLLLKSASRLLEEDRQKLESKQQDMADMQRENLELSKEIGSYRKNFIRLSEQMASAVNAYRNIVNIDTAKCKIKMAARFRPLSWLGGDFYDYCNTGSGCDIFTADVSGHGMGASYHGVLLKSFFEENSKTGKDGPTFFRLLNRQLIGIQQTKRVVAALFCRINLEAGFADIVSAGHPPLIHLTGKEDMTMIPIEGHSREYVLGVRPDASFQSQRFPIASKQRLIFYTNGITDVTRENGSADRKNRFSEARMLGCIQENRKLPLEEMINALWNEVIKFCEDKPGDDMLLLGVEIP